MRFHFTKMQALGNDYILIDGTKYGELTADAERLAITMSDRHFGVGGDGIIFVMPSESADARMRIFNADGSEAEMCGNGIRQVAKYIYDKGIVRKKEMAIDSGAGVKAVVIEAEGGKMKSATVNMGAPILETDLIPVKAEMNRGSFAVVSLTSEGRDFDFTPVSMGNPHAVAFVSEVDEMDVAKYGRPVELMTNVFPRRTNVEFIEMVSPSEIRMRVWERGSGETLACGTGASASVVAAVLNGLTGRNVTVHLLGGDLFIEWAENGRVYMTGGAEIAFEGEGDTSYFLK
ncbi:MAG: diaminopimelate epimerase [Spirochaetes bacterium GWF1_51_8]|nr:MAG: diaminopimelate epimerase [Spirochaetes bacterium GWF1_51_8]